MTNKGEMLYCSCDAFIGRTGASGNDAGKTVRIIPKGCSKCQKEYGTAKEGFDLIQSSLDAMLEKYLDSLAKEKAGIEY